MNAFKNDVPIYLQLRQQIEEQILARALKEEDQVKSLRVLAAEYRINPITAGNALNTLVNEGVLYQKRGIGIFVSQGAREKIINSRKSSFIVETLEPSIRLAKSYDIPKEEIIAKTNSIYGEEQ
ncbi:MAG: GntR family transcriptional regulator [Candidatus Cloacimonetes bacterium]|jgi:DNA-binding transcriptional regulator YhcF (GntR family)|nr:GntR family transcriptional regulator [Candidatus Cloacimonadota bacterium]MDY0336995.1 GntR family transcriptional regulator [Candidatus Cloacimonadaceae bacterium]MCB5269785.1 GntR family transcriptional regulator [Candidatus Cloacimonadota bacterium]MCK9334631.1 GntR family transcriptional regulator [Candidatus Cloacimonadota bacterium]MDD2543332.1 GntR family transcriptional regulator [Candidatus Cloacimonadota bacterium]